ncbi:succinate dehydrogenase assembly factor 4 [Azospirillum sp. SYSU D00513]|uniref:DUF1674 domain-containing protein n=1 Tax=Azospirillum sp. SYSU D00513 TaxID=2812561 RepID=UPI001A95B3CB|nr:succinate dehydrogenase assembly factor 4 [Azospirillum sp. SYSU D00513]
MTDKTPTPDKKADATPPAADAVQGDSVAAIPEQMPGEIGGPKGPEPTRFGDWEFKGRCSDF